MIRQTESPLSGDVGKVTSQPPNEESDDEDEDPLFFLEDESDYEPSSPSDQDSDFEDLITEEDGSSNGRRSGYNSTPTKERVQGRRRKLFKRWKKVKEKKALIELKARLEDALLGNYLFQDEEKKGLMPQNLKDITLWGVPLLPSKGHEGTDIILLKFLKAQNFKASEALKNLKQTLIWRAEQKIDEVANEELGDKNELNKMVFIDSVDKEGHPLCFNLYGAFRDKELYAKTFGTEQNRKDYLRWRIQFMEESIKKLSFKQNGADSFLLITDMKNAPGPGNSMKELGPISKDAVSLFQRHYPELIYKHIIINAPFWYYLYHSLVTQYCTPGTRKKFVFARPQKVTETLLKFIPPQNIPLQYGGLRRENDDEFSSDDPVLEFSLRGGALSNFQLPISELNVTLLWDIIVVGWEVTYKDEFIPEDEGSYRILLHEEEKIGNCVRNSYYINEPGKILITIKNCTYIRKRVFIRLKSKETLPLYMQYRK